MASIQLYTQGLEQGEVSYTLAEANFLEATADTHYVQEGLNIGTNPITSEPTVFLHLSVPAAGMDYLTINKSYCPVVSSPLKTNGEGHWYPETCDITTTALTTQPPDWELHFRDKYNGLHYQDWHSGADTAYFYYAWPLSPPVYTNDPPTFESGMYYNTNQSRYIYWTLDGNYFSFENGWYLQSGGIEQGIRFCYTGNDAGSHETLPNVNYPKYNGVSGSLPFSYSSYSPGQGSAGSAFAGNLFHHYSPEILYTSTQLDPHVFCNFIGFRYRYTDSTGEEPEQKEAEFVGLVIWKEGIDGTKLEAQIFAITKNFWGLRKKPGNGGPISGIQGGNGSFSAPSNNRGDRTGATAAGIASTWNQNTTIFSPGYNNYMLGSPDVSAFSEMIQSLWDPDVIQGFKNLMMNPINAVVCCHQIPANLAPTTTTGSDHIKAANVTLTDSTVPTFSQWITHWHGGDIDISQYTDSFADYTNTAIYIHLPYIGTQLLDTAACMDGWLSVDYLTDVISGQCTALVTTCDRFGNTQMRYEFKGDCSRNVELHQKVPMSTKIAQGAIPAIAGAAIGGIGGSIAASSYASKVAGSVQYSMERLGGDSLEDEDIQWITQNLPDSSGVVATATKGGTISSAATTALTSAQSTASSNASGGDVTSPIDTQIWVLITRPQWSNPELYAREKAYPSDISGKIGEFEGLLVVSTAELNNIDCTDTERSEIMQRLIAGVYTS